MCIESVPENGFAVEGEPFANAEEAWIWAVQAMRCRLSGANIKAGMATIVRPCEASDIFAAASFLERNGHLSRNELRVMLLYGGYAVSPSVLGPSHRSAVPYWLRAISALSLILEQKGVITGPQKMAGDVC